MKRYFGAGILCVLFLAACDEGPPSPPVVVFATGEDGGALSMLFADFTDDTGVPVRVEWGTSAENANRLINKSGAPADVLITDNVADTWRAADEGALRPIRSDAFDSTQDFLALNGGVQVADFKQCHFLHLPFVGHLEVS